MSAKINVTFFPKEFVYYYDCIRIRLEGQILVIPLHAYPVVNKINFPKVISFGDSPLCEPVSKVLSVYNIRSFRLTPPKFSANYPKMLRPNLVLLLRRDN